MKTLSPCVEEPLAYCSFFHDTVLALDLEIPLDQQGWLGLDLLDSLLDSNETRQTLLQGLLPEFSWDFSARAINDPKGRFPLAETYCWDERNLESYITLGFGMLHVERAALTVHTTFVYVGRPGQRFSFFSLLMEMENELLVSCEESFGDGNDILKK